MFITKENIDIGYSDFRTQIMTVKELVDIWNNRNLQSRCLLSRIPSQKQCSRYIESLLIGMPLPLIYVDNVDNDWIIIEGADRIKAYADFCDGRFALCSLYFTMSRYEGLYFLQMSNLAKNNILNTKIQVNVLNSGLTRIERFGIYTCLKSRIDANTLRSCRKYIYGETYPLIENIARQVKEVSNKNSINSAYLENEICHLLLSSMYKSFVLQGVAANIDVLVNFMLEDESFEELIDTSRDKIIRTLIFTRNCISKRFGMRVHDMYNALIFHSQEVAITEDKFINIYKMTNLQSESTDDILAFSHQLEQILKHYK